MSPDEVLKTEGTEVACSEDSPRKTPTQKRGFQQRGLRLLIPVKTSSGVRPDGPGVQFCKSTAKRRAKGQS